MAENFISLYPSRGHYCYDDPDPRCIKIGDIAHSLSQMCRYAGHTPKFYSVAEHCCRVSLMLRDAGKSSAIQLKGLLHDASEAYCVDIPSPMKHNSKMESGYMFHEMRAQEVIAAAFGLKMPIEDPVVMEADVAILAPEQAWGRTGENPHGFGWDSGLSRIMYHNMFNYLTGARFINGRT